MIRIKIIIRTEKLTTKKFGIKKKIEKLNNIIERDANNDISNRENLYVRLITKKINIESIEDIIKYEAIFLFGSLALMSGKSAPNL